jgi:two-component system sensor histidine kinase AlgZ
LVATIALAIHAVVGSAALYLLVLVHEPFQNFFMLYSFGQSMGFLFDINLWHLDLQSTVFYILLGRAWNWLESGNQARIDSLILEKKLVRSELNTLKSQLDPHFLFNVLNGVSCLVRAGKEKQATKALNDLSVLLRHILEHRSSDTVMVKEELKCVDLYIQIQTLRFGDQLRFTQEIDGNATRALIPSHLLLPLIENAIVHGSRNPFAIRLKIAKQDDTIVVQVENHLSDDRNIEGFGIGLGNNLVRMQLLYGDECFFDYGPAEEGRYRVSIGLPYTTHEMRSQLATQAVAE